MIATSTFKIGDSVVVKSGVVDPDLNIDIGGWQGRITEVDDAGSVFITWDSVTLLHMGKEVIMQCENENLDWKVMTLDGADVEKTSSRDSIADVLRTARSL
jgi:hypothetical protein